MTGMRPGSLEGVQLVVTDIEALRRELVSRGAVIGEIGDLGGLKLAHFSDLDGNRRGLQGQTPTPASDARPATG